MTIQKDRKIKSQMTALLALVSAIPIFAGMGSTPLADGAAVRPCAMERLPPGSVSPQG